MSTKSEQLELARSYGATSTPGNGWWYTHELNGWRIWPAASRGGWVAAQLINERYTGHNYHVTLDEALLFAQSTQT